MQRDLSVFYGDAQALAGVHIDVAEREIVVIIGANGAGKTSLLRTVGGVLAPRDDSIRFECREIASAPSHKVCNLGIGQVAEGRQVFPGLSAREPGDRSDPAAGPRATAAALEHVFAMFERLHERCRQAPIRFPEANSSAIGRC